MSTEIPKELKEYYLNEIPHKINNLKNIIDKVKKSPSIESLKSLKDEVHKIIGNSKAYGFDKVSDLSREFDTFLLQKMDNIAEKNDKNDIKWISICEEYIAKIEKEFDNHEI